MREIATTAHNDVANTVDTDMRGEETNQLAVPATPSGACRQYKRLYEETRRQLNATERELSEAKQAIALASETLRLARRRPLENAKHYLKWKFAEFALRHKRYLPQKQQHRLAKRLQKYSPPPKQLKQGDGSNNLSHLLANQRPKTGLTCLREQIKLTKSRKEIETRWILTFRLLLPKSFQRKMERRLQKALSKRQDTQIKQVQAAPLLPPVGRALPLANTVHRKYKVYQVFCCAEDHSGLASVHILDRWLQAMGFETITFAGDPSYVTVEHVRELRDLPAHSDCILLIHHRLGDVVPDRIFDVQASKILIYHGIPASGRSDLRALGERQLRKLGQQVRASIVANNLEALELHGYGLGWPFVCDVLAGVNELLAEQPAQEKVSYAITADIFTVVCIGDIIEANHQLELIAVFDEFAKRYGRSTRLVLVERTTAKGGSYVGSVLRAVKGHGLEDSVTLTHALTLGELNRWCRSAGCLISLSDHDFDSLDLACALALDIPIVTRSSGETDSHFEKNSPHVSELELTHIASALLQLASDNVFRQRAVFRQKQFWCEKLDAESQKDKLTRALVAAGAAEPLDTSIKDWLKARLTITVTGHFNGSYSLAAINRSMAMALAAKLPSRVNILPWESGPNSDRSSWPKDQLAVLTKLAARTSPANGPHVVISQHYPLYIPANRGSALLALIAWEESLLPPEYVANINENLDGILSPTQFVTKALIDSGVSIPIYTVGQAPDLTPYLEVAEKQASLTRCAHEPFTFLHVSSCFPRKGVDRLLGAFAKAFKKLDPVRLIIKGFPNPHNDVPQQLERLRAQNPDLAEIIVINQDATAEEVLKLYERAHAVVLPTRGEGFNIPATEAMAAKIPLIVTGHGAQLDFCNAENARLIDFSFAGSGSHVHSAGSVWVDPDEEDLVRALHEAYEAGGASHEQIQSQLAQAQQGICDRLDQGRWAERIEEAALKTLTRRHKQMRLAWLSTWGVRCGIAEYSRLLLREMYPGPEASTDHLTILSDGRTPESHSESRSILPVWGEGKNPTARELAHLVERIDPNVLVLQHHPGLASYFYIAQLLSDERIKRRKTVVTLHAVPIIETLHANELRFTIKSLATVDRILVHNLCDLNLLKQYGLTANVTLFPHGAPKRQSIPAISERPLTGRVVIGCYGFFLPHKGIGRLIEAVALLRNKWPRIHLQLTNAQFPSEKSTYEIQRCRKLAKKLGIFDKIEWELGFLPEEESWAKLEKCDVIVLPYDDIKESASGALRVALASGVPVAVSPAKVFDEAEDAVFRFDAISSQSIADGLEFLLNNTDVRKRIQKSAVSWLEGRSWNVLARRLGGMLRGLDVNDRNHEW